MQQLRNARRRNLRTAAGGANRIVVVDTETTGVYPTDRILEIALVTLSLDGEVLDVWDTLVQPERDVGASHIHGITASMLAYAPVFGDIAGDVAYRLDGACVAAHNLPFDRRMLGGEFGRIGVDLSIQRGIDTLRVTRSKLAEACAQHRITLDGAHRALTDAVATANLLLRVSELGEPGGPVAVAALPRHGRVYRREDSGPVVLPDPPVIAHLAFHLAHRGVEVNILTYLELVDRCIGDLHLDPGEQLKLTELARDLGLNDAHIEFAHRRYLNELIDTALDDHEVTPEEYEVLVRVAAALGVDQAVVEQRTRAARAKSISVTVTQGLRVVFTGMHPKIDRAELVAHAGALAFERQSQVTKKTDLLVAADPETRSRKALTARRYGTPIISAEQFTTVRIDDTLQLAGPVVELKVISCPDCLATRTVPAASAAQRSTLCSGCAGASLGPLRAESSPSISRSSTLVTSSQGERAPEPELPSPPPEPELRPPPPLSRIPLPPVTGPNYGATPRGVDVLVCGFCGKTRRRKGSWWRKGPRCRVCNR